jgi:hypothetical protein
VDLPSPEQLQLCQEVPQCCRDHVYIFLVNGLDPLNATNLTGVRDYLHSLCYQKVYYGQFFHRSHYEAEIRRIHQCDPDARFVLLGFSLGANMVRTMAHDAQKDGVTIDLLVYCGGNTLKNVPTDQPENAERILNILAHGYIWHGDNMERAENIQVSKSWHFGSPAHPYTIQTLTHELALVAARVPFREPPGEMMVPAEETAPAPRAVPGQPTALRDEWDFLKPAPRFGDPIVPADQPSIPKTSSVAHNR